MRLPDWKLEQRFRFGHNQVMENRLREIRLAKGLSQLVLAERVGTTKSTISKLEQGKRQLTLEWLTLLAEALGCHEAELIGGSPSINQEELSFLSHIRQLGDEDKKAVMRLLNAFAKSGPVDKEEGNQGAA